MPVAEKKPEASKSFIPYEPAPGEEYMNEKQLAHFRHEFYGEEAGERTAVLRRRLPAPAPAPANPTPAATNSSPLAPVPLGEALRNHLAELSETGQA